MRKKTKASKSKIRPMSVRSQRKLGHQQQSEPTNSASRSFDPGDHRPASETRLSGKFPADMLNPEERRKWDLPSSPQEQGPYIIELNNDHVGGLPGAANQFLSLAAQHITQRPRR